jgi:hypothetical protein
MNLKAPRLHSTGFLLPLILTATAFSLMPSLRAADAEPGKAAKDKSEAKPTVAAANAPTKVLVFRNVRSWRRKMDFEEVLTNLGFQFEVKPSTDMESADLAPYNFIIIPGAQWQENYYHDYADNAARFDRYVTNGGTLVLELNGAEQDGITLPGGVTMAKHGSTDNIITVPDHPILLPLAGKPIHANYASHGYLKNVPKGALILVTEGADDQPIMDKPTFLEYACGKGRVIAACQCFHDQDGSGRGPLMEGTINYAAERQWFVPKK